MCFLVCAVSMCYWFMFVALLDVWFFAIWYSSLFVCVVCLFVLLFCLHLYAFSRFSISISRLCLFVSLYVLFKIVFCSCLYFIAVFLQCYCCSFLHIYTHIFIYTLAGTWTLFWMFLAGGGGASFRLLQKLFERCPIVVQKLPNCCPISCPSRRYTKCQPHELYTFYSLAL